MSVTFKMLSTDKVQKMLKNAVKKSKEASDLAFTDTVLLAHKTAVERARSRKIRPFWQTGNYTKLIFPDIRTASGKFTGKILAQASYSKKLEDLYQNLKISADMALKEFPKLMEQAYKETMRKKR